MVISFQVNTIGEEWNTPKSFQQPLHISIAENLIIFKHITADCSIIPIGQNLQTINKYLSNTDVWCNMTQGKTDEKIQTVLEQRKCN